jgi:hypothetical protein
VHLARFTRRMIGNREDVEPALAIQIAELAR